MVVCCVSCFSLCLSVLTFGTSLFPRLPSSIAIWLYSHYCCLLYFADCCIIIIFYPRQSLFSAHTHTTHNTMHKRLKFFRCTTGPLTVLFPIVDIYLSCEFTTQQICAMVPRLRFLRHFCVLYFQRAACGTFRTCIRNLH